MPGAHRAEGIIRRKAAKLSGLGAARTTCGVRRREHPGAHTNGTVWPTGSPWLTWRYWREEDQPSKADKVARLAWDGGCHEPRLASVYAGLLAAPGTDAALKAGISSATKR